MDLQRRQVTALQIVAMDDEELFYTDIVVDGVPEPIVAIVKRADGWAINEREYKANEYVTIQNAKK